MQNEVIPPFLPIVESKHYSHNLLKQVVCELKFPVLFELDDSKLSAHLIKAFKTIRKEFPNYEHLIQKNISTNYGDTLNHVYLFRTKDKKTSVSIRSSAISLETTNYQSFDILSKQIERIIKLSKDIIDSDYFTRIGLRYINFIPYENMNSIKEWIRDDLVESITTQPLGLISNYSTIISGATEFGGYAFKHGVTVAPSTEKSNYYLDFDFWSENIEISDALSTIKNLHDYLHTMFEWSIGNKAREFLNSSQ